MSVRELLESEITGFRALVAGVVAFAGVVGGGFELLASTAGTWFPMVAVSATAILPEFGYQRVGERLLLLAAFIYVGVLAARWYDKARGKSES